PRAVPPPAGRALPGRTVGGPRFCALPGYRRVPGLAVATGPRPVRRAGPGPPQRWTESSAPVYGLELGGSGGVRGGGRSPGPGAGLRISGEQARRAARDGCACGRGEASVIVAGGAEAGLRLSGQTHGQQVTPTAASSASPAASVSWPPRGRRL